MFRKHSPVVQLCKEVGGLFSKSEGRKTGDKTVQLFINRINKDFIMYNKQIKWKNLIK